MTSRCCNVLKYESTGTPDTSATTQSLDNMWLLYVCFISFVEIVVNGTSDLLFPQRRQRNTNMSEYSNLSRLASKLKLLNTTEDYINKIRQLKTDEERFSLALEMIIQHFAPFSDPPECKRKESNHSITSRENGNKSFRVSQYYKAIREYTESIVYAVNSSEELALAYANRSAALFELEKYADCVEDIDRALNSKFPDKLKTKLYKRKGLCLTKLGRPGTDSTFKEALVWLDKMGLSKSEMNRIKSELDKLTSAPYAIAKLPDKVMQPPLPEIVKPNREVPCASAAVALRYTEKFGRHLVATRQIKPGEILVVEKPYCTRLIARNVYTHCSHCLQVSWTLIPCKCCVNKAYCSEACRDEAWNKYHEVECPVVGFLHRFDSTGILGFSLRMAIMATHKGKSLNSLKEELMNVNCNRDPRTKGFSNDGKFHSDQYRSVYSLTDNLDKKSALDILSRAFWVALTVVILARKSNMFGKSLPLDTLAKNPDVIFVGGLILKIVHIGSVNIYSFGAARSARASAHGKAMMAFSSFFNHSCDPNVLRQWYAGHMVIFSLYTIEQGEQIFDNYASHCFDTAKTERVKRIEYWDFNCECVPCTKNWPLLEDLPSYKEQPLSQQAKNKIYKTLNKMDACCNYMLQINTIESTLNMFEQLVKSIEILCNLTQRPNKELGDLILMLKEFYQSTDTVYAFEPASPSEKNELSSMFYRSLQYKFSQK